MKGDSGLVDAEWGTMDEIKVTMGKLGVGTSFALMHHGLFYLPGLFVIPEILGACTRILATRDPH